MARQFSRTDLNPSQEDTAKLVKDHDRCAIWSRMGMGKTVSVLTAIVELKREFDIDKVLVISRKRVIDSVWPKEIQQWAHTRHLTFHDLRPAIYRNFEEKLTKNKKGEVVKKKRIAVYHVDDALLKKEADIYLISQEYIPHICTVWGQKWPYDMVVLDDIKGIKQPSSTYFRKLRSVSPKIDRLVHMNGTPSGNSQLLSLWPQLYLIDHGERLGRTMTKYKKDYFDQDYNGFSWSLKENAADEIHERVKDRCFALEPDMELGPDPIFRDIEIELPATLRAQYRELEKEFLLELEDTEVEASSAGVLAGKLLQFCNGAMYVQPEKEDRERRPKKRAPWRKIHDLKLEVLDEIVSEASGEPLLLAYNFIHDRERILKQFPQAATLDTPEFQTRWDRKEIPLAVMHPGSAGHGLNLQHGGHMAVWFGLNWSLELTLQFNERIGQIRQAQSGYFKTPIYYRILIKDSADTDVRDALEGNATTERELLSAVRRRIEQRVQ